MCSRNVYQRNSSSFSVGILLQKLGFYRVGVRFTHDPRCSETTSGRQIYASRHETKEMMTF